MYEHLPEERRRCGLSLPAWIRGLEKHLVTDALERTKGNISRAAKELGIMRTTLQMKLRSYSKPDRKYRS